jgi:predicted AlkP superfamily pyrophosphatase or phosphodiesterase
MKRLALASILAVGIAVSLSGARQPAHSVLVIVVDGLRPDYVTQDVMPRLAQLGRRGVVFAAHHSVFPTVTRVNASSFVTGAYPESHGLMGNTIYIPKASPTKPLDTGKRENLELVERADGALLTAPTLSEILRLAGKTMLVVSSGSSGSALLLNHTLAAGGIVNYDFVRPAALADAASRILGPPPPQATPNDPRNQYAVDAYLKIGIEQLRPDVTFMWLNDPDGTAHANGIGTPLTNRSLTLVDAAIGRVEDTLRTKGLLDRTDIIVTSDHGFSTHTGTLKLPSLVSAFARPMPDGSPDLVVAEGAVYFRSGPDPARRALLVKALQSRPEVGAIFTAAASPHASEGVVPGTLSFDLIRWNHPSRAGDVLVSANWTSDKNAAGFAGTTTDGGVAGHGTSSPYDIHNTLIAAGPSFRERAVSHVPTGNVDIAPTVLRLIGVSVPNTMAGRVITEGLRSGPAPSSIAVQHADRVVRTPDESYTLTAHLSTVDGRTYLDFTEVTRK